ncbi:MAG: TRAP transporter TatT component family protein, partial [Pseudomonadota bacterium]
MALLFLSGCASIVSNATSSVADNVTLAILNQNDPATVRDGAPSFLLMIDGFIEGDPENTKLLLSGAKLYGSYTSAFLVEDQVRAQRLSTKAFTYAHRALCLEVESVCRNLDKPLKEFVASFESTDRSDITVLFGFAAAWAGWIQANASDWNAIADVARLTALLEHC